MKNKSIYIVIGLLITATLIPIVGCGKTQNKTTIIEELDQYQEKDDECYYITTEWQEFKPTKTNHVRVEVKIVQWYGGSPDLRLSIEKPLGTTLTFTDVPVTSIPSGTADWVSFDIPDYDLVPGQKYYLVLTAPLGSEYGWCGGAPNPYHPR